MTKEITASPYFMRLKSLLQKRIYTEINWINHRDEKAVCAAIEIAYGNWWTFDLTDAERKRIPMDLEDLLEQGGI